MKKFFVALAMLSMTSLFLFGCMGGEEVTEQEEVTDETAEEVVVPEVTDDAEVVAEDAEAVAEDAEVVAEDAEALEETAEVVAE
jgi:hypothetical protein